MVYRLIWCSDVSSIPSEPHPPQKQADGTTTLARVELILLSSRQQHCRRDMARYTRVSVVPAVESTLSQIAEALFFRPTRMAAFACGDTEATLVP